MTEAEWLACGDPLEMLEFLEGKTSDRKMRLFGVALCRGAWSMFHDERARSGVEEAERWADGEGNEERLSLQHQLTSDIRCDQALWSFQGTITPDISDEMYRTANAASAVCFNNGHIPLVAMLRLIQMLTPAVEPPPAEAARSALLRDIIGNPFRPGALSASLRTPTVTELARVAYAEQALPSGCLDPVRLAVLADAVEEAGCTDADFLGHLRGPGPHVRGCWALDLLLGKG